MASKKASCSSPVSLRTLAARSGEVRGPVAMMTLSQSSGGSCDFAAFERNQRVRAQRRRDRGGKAVAVDRQRAAGRHLVLVGGTHHQRAEPAHFGMQQADRVVVFVVGAERVRADQFGKAVGLVGRRLPLRPHLVQRHRHARLRELPGGLRARQSAADDMDGFQCHGCKLGVRSPKRNRPRQAAGGFETNTLRISAGALLSRPRDGYPSG